MTRPLHKHRASGEPKESAPMKRRRIDTRAIAKFENAVRQSGGDPNAGPLARQTVGAQLGYQPTPASIKRAEAKAKAKFDAVLARAKRRDARGDRAGCKI